MDVRVRARAVYASLMGKISSSFCLLRSVAYLGLAIIYRFPIPTFIALLISVPLLSYLWLRFDIGWQGHWFQLAYWLRHNPERATVIFITVAVLPSVLLNIMLGFQRYAYNLFRSQWQRIVGQTHSFCLRPLLLLVGEQTMESMAEKMFFFRLVKVGGTLAIAAGTAWIGGIAAIQALHPVQVSASHGCVTAVNITSNTTWSTNQCLGDVTITNGATLTIAGNTNHQLSSLTLGNGVTNGFITAQGDTVNGVGVTLTVEGNVEVKSGSSINADAQGYAVSNGPGAGTGGQRGGGYGGMGFGGTGSFGGDTYGSLKEPTSIGSGGTSYKGGGAIKLTISGDLTNNGTISANGQGGCGSCSGGGSGGSVWINFTGGSSAWAGSGSITAAATWHGGGGRIAVTGYTTDTHSGSVNAFTTSNPGSPGTVYLRSSSQTYGTAIIDNNNVALRHTAVAGDDTYTKSNSTNLILDSLIIKRVGTFLIPSGSSLTIPSSGSIEASDNGTFYNQGTITMASSASFAGNSAGVTQNEGMLTLSGSHSLAHKLIHRGAYTAKMALDGVNDMMQVSAFSQNSTYTIEGWFYPTNTGTVQSLIARHGSTAGYRLYIDTDGTVKLWVMNTTISSSATVSNNNWYHIAGVVSGTTAKIFVNGEEVGNGSIASTSHSGSTFFIGRNGVTAAEYYAGKLDEIRISDSARYSTSFTPSNTFTVDANTQALWKFDEPNGITSLDNTRRYALNLSSLNGSNGAGTTSGWTDVTISELATLTGDATLTIASGGSLAADGPLTNTDLDIVVQSGGNLTHSDNGTGEQYKMNISIGNLTVNSGGTVNVNSLGYDLGYGPGYGARGAGYGGQGGDLEVVGETYGSILAPDRIGSAGGSCGSSTGGGAIKITLSGNLINNGTISANGGSSCYGGSGGSVWIVFTGESSTWSGSGNVTADAIASFGGGGRIAITGYVIDTHSGSITAYSKAAAGTIYLKSANQVNGELVVDNNNETPVLSGRYTKTGVTNLTLDAFTIRNKGTFIIPTDTSVTIASGGTASHAANTTTLNRGTFTSTGATHTISGTFTADGTTAFGAVTVASGGTINHSDNSTEEIYRATIAATSMTVASGGLIDVSGLGFDGGTVSTIGYGPGAGAGAANGSLSGGGGGGHGGVGGTGAGASGGAGGSSYGSITEPVTIGSGGGGGDMSVGGAGGGAAKITVSGNLTVAGTIRANGLSGTLSTYGGGAGAGGSIWLIVGGDMNCTGGVVTANGGDDQGSTVSGGGGAGGRLVRNVTGTYMPCTTYAATAGTGGTGAAAGSSYVPASAPSGLTPSMIAATSVTWSFTDTSTTETMFRLYNATHGLAGSVTSLTTAGTGTGYQISETSLSPNTAYTRYVVAFDGTANGVPSANTTVYTLANTPGAPSVAGTTTSSLTVTISVNSNPSSTQFAIFDDTTDQYVQADGSLGASAAWQTYLSWGGVSGQTVTGLSPNVGYVFQVKARNDDNVETAFSAGTAKYTLANTPGTPTLSDKTNSGLTVTLAVNSNPTATQFAIFDDLTDQYVQSNGTLGASVAWQTYAGWGGVSGQGVSGLLPNTNYTFQAKARNGDSVETALSSGAPIYTLASTPGIPVLSGETSSSLTVVLATNGNPSATQYSLAFTMSDGSSYLQGDGTLDATRIWQTYSSWGEVTGASATGLLPNTTYSVVATARNSDNIVTAASSAATLTTLAVVPVIDSVEPTSATGVRVKLNTFGNPNGTEFAIYNATSGLYLQADGSLGSPAAWQTYIGWGGATGIVNTGLSSATTYSYQVKARNSAGIATALSAAKATTTAVAPDTSTSSSSSDDGNSEATEPTSANPSPSPTPTAASTNSSKPSPSPSPATVALTATPSPEPTVSPIDNEISPEAAQAVLQTATENEATEELETERPATAPCTAAKQVIRILVGVTLCPESQASSIVTQIPTTYLFAQASSNWGLVGVTTLSTAMLVTSSLSFQFGHAFREIIRFLIALGNFLWVNMLLWGKPKDYGQVLDATTNRPIAFARVDLHVGSRNGLVLRSTLTDRYGRFMFVASPGYYVLSASQVGYVPAEERTDGYQGTVLDVRHLEDVAVTLYLKPKYAPVVKRSWSQLSMATLGFVSALYIFVINPSVLLVGILIVYLVTLPTMVWPKLRAEQR